MRRISGFIISFLLLVSTPAMAQTDMDVPGLYDTIPVPGLRFGVNIIRPLLAFYEPMGWGAELTADYTPGNAFFAVAETGFSLRNFEEQDYRIEQNGMFFRLGADRNFYNQFDDVVAVGARLGASFYRRSAPFITIDDGYWGGYTGVVDEEFFFRQWLEVVVVLKTEIFNNVFFGWNLRGKVLLFDRADRHMDERYIPGFGGGSSTTNAGFDFYIYYRFPLKNR
jgi:hypothetical protein